MDNNLPVPYKTDISDDYQVEIRERKIKKRKGATIIKLLIFISLCLVVYFVFMKNQSKILPFFSNLFNEPENEVPTPNVDENQNNFITDKNEAVVPPYIHNILSVDMTQGEDINESGGEVAFAEFTPVTAKEISARYGKEAPLVLIIHSNPTRSYSDGKAYSENGSFYSDTKNVAEIGTVFQNVLEENGIKSIHISDTYGSSLYSSSEKYEKSIVNALKKYPSISYVFDISRGMYINPDLTMEKGTALIENKHLAQIKFIVGKTDGKNATFASLFKENIKTAYSDFICPTTYSLFSLNQEFCPSSLRIEIGSYGNSFEEAQSSAVLLANAFTDFVNADYSQ